MRQQRLQGIEGEACAPAPQTAHDPLRHPLPGACPTCSFPPGAPGFVREDVPLGHPHFGKAIPCPTCHDAKRAEKLRQGSQLDGWLTSATFDGYWLSRDNREAFDAAREFAGRATGWLTLWGAYGPGKTHLLAAIVNDCTARGVAGAYFTLADLLDRLRDSYDEQGFSALFDRLAAAPVLALDEVDKVNPTGWAKEKIFQLAEARYRSIARRGTVFAMNLAPDPEHPTFGWLFSRMADWRGRVVQVGGGDVRGVLGG